jgi:aryl-alcohol dehydrogenase-like predicted oxidoreductase
MMNRRHFLEQLALAGGTLLGASGLMGAVLKPGDSDRLGALLPTRPFGKSGERITFFGLGGFHLPRAERNGVDPQAIIEKALEGGIRFFDTAYNYYGGRAEELYGKYLTPNYREDVFLLSKSDAGSAKTAQEHLETSLRRLKTDYLDLWVMHSVDDPADAEQRFEAGVFDAFLEAKASGKVRYIGCSGHVWPAGHRRVMELATDEIDYFQLPVNAVDASAPDSFTSGLLPDLAKNGYAIGAMKSFADGRFFRSNRVEDGAPLIPNYLSVRETLWFVLSQPITCLISGNEKLEHLDENLDAVRQFAGLSKDEQARIISSVEKYALDGSLATGKRRR